MAKIPVAPVGGEGGGFVCGVYTGDGAASKHIELGFRPKAVLVVSEDGATSWDSVHYGGVALEGKPCTVGLGFLAVAVSANGFTIYESKTTGRDVVCCNTANKNYHYIAFR